MPMQPEFTVSDAGDPATREIIVRGLTAFNVANTGKLDYRPLAVLVRDPVSGETLGGLWGRTAWRWFYVELLFVPEAMRRGGVGRELMRRAEAEAVARGCHAVWLDTFSFQARGFYEKLGYSLFGRLDDYPPGHSRFFMRKELGPTGDSVA